MFKTIKLPDFRSIRPTKSTSKPTTKLQANQRAQFPKFRRKKKSLIEFLLNFKNSLVHDFFNEFFVSNIFSTLSSFFSPNSYRNRLSSVSLSLFFSWPHSTSYFLKKFSKSLKIYNLNRAFLHQPFNFFKNSFKIMKIVILFGGRLNGQIRRQFYYRIYLINWVSIKKTHNTLSLLFFKSA